jgi:hypothetical protein
MNLANFESSVRDIKEDDGAERIYVTTLDITQELADQIIYGLQTHKETAIDFTKDNGIRQIIRLKVLE